MIDVHNGYMLLGESMLKNPVCPSLYTPPFVPPVIQSYERDAWSLFQLDNSPNAEPELAEMVQGMWRWEREYGSVIDGVAMCEEENMVAIADTM